MSDEQQIANLIYTYAELMDAGDFAGVGDLLDRAAVTFEGFDVVRTGAPVLSALYSATTRRFDDGTPRTKHVTTNVQIEVSGTTARARSYFTVLQAVPGALALQPIIAGRYRDAFTEVDETWRFSARHVVVDLMGDLSAHLLMDLD